MFTVAEIAAATGGRVMGSAEAGVAGVSTDSRSVVAGELFVPLRGERFDGHDFIAEVAAKGITAVLADEKWLAHHTLPPGCSRRRCQGYAARLGRSGGGLSAAFRHPGHRRHRQQRQNHHQGDAGNHTGTDRAGPENRGQPQQPDRCAPDAVPSEAGTPLGGAGDGHERTGRDRPPGGDCPAPYRHRAERLSGAPAEHGHGRGRCRGQGGAAPPHQRRRSGRGERRRPAGQRPGAKRVGAAHQLRDQPRRGPGQGNRAPGAGG